MKLGVIADDFTGASDIGLTLAEGGFRVAQVNGVPEGPTPFDAVNRPDAVVVALKSRTEPVDQAVANALAACDWLRAQGAKQIVFKVCSTFDSTPKGNIGPVLDALAQRLGATTVPVCPAFPENGRSVYQGHLFVGDRLLNESGMQDHPLTPMTDPDLRRVLAAQSQTPVGHIPAGTVRCGAGAIETTLSETSGHLIVDAIEDDDLRQIGQAARALPLLCGGSGIAIGLPANHGATPATPGWQPISGPGVVLSGSCSRATRAQVETYRSLAPAREITAEAAVNGTISVLELVDWVLAQDRPPLIYSSADPEVVRGAQTRFGRGRAAAAIEELFAQLAAALARAGVRRIVVAGGETSGAVTRGLNADLLHIGPRIAPGVPLLRLDPQGGQPDGQQDGIALALKSGNFGAPDFFSRALNMMEGAA